MKLNLGKRAVSVLLVCALLASSGVVTAFADEATAQAVTATYAKLSEQTAQDLDLETIKAMIQEAYEAAEANRSALKDNKQSIDTATYELFRLGADLSMKIVDQLTEEEKTANNNPYGLCCHYVAECFKDGTGVEKDLDSAAQWYEVAIYTFACSRSTLNYAEMMFNAGRYAESFEAYRYAWETSHHMKAARYIGLFYQYGYGDVVEVDCQTAEQYYKAGAEAGDGTSWALWANLYCRQLMGKGKPANFRQTAYDILTRGLQSSTKLESLEDKAAVEEALKKASSAAVNDMVFLMGYVCEMGYGDVAADLEEASFWYGLYSGESSSLHYSFDEAQTRVAQKISGEWVEWDKNYGGVDKMLDTELVENREQLASLFQQLEYVYDGGSFWYNLYLPEGYDPSREYPVVLFLHDGSITSQSDVRAPLMQGWGATIWTQEDEDVIVVAPTGYDTSAIFGFMDSLKAAYSIDENRVYLTGQSAGCIAAYALNDADPDYFTATLYVSGQASGDIPTYEELSDAYADQKWLFVSSAGDTQAYPGIQVLMTKLKDQGASFAQTQFSAALPLDQQSDQVDRMLLCGKDRNIVIFDEGTVTWYNLPTVFPDETPTNPEHMYAFDAAYKLDSARAWLLSQSKDAGLWQRAVNWIETVVRLCK